MKALLSLAETAEYIGVSEETLRRYVRDGSFPVKPRSIGYRSHLRFSVAELDRWLQGEAA